ncbi:hypothetical protein SLEP1_g55791 [Rubroshorea leprosula]|uniref:Uncharacterized protein n=1 Tax=Rubroshorea leprosula TaxID=152421 RepID=A0AAV5MKP6_9ROSI|nr:hypothetical protein SLEP1_g55791 [Rubroshorea leprosula]
MNWCKIPPSKVCFEGANQHGKRWLKIVREPTNLVKDG